MASGDDRAAAPDGLDGTGLRIGLVKARWNAEIVDRLEAGVDRGLLHLGVPASDIVVESVPGSFEVPMGARILATSGEVDAIVTIGCVIRGETTHYELVSEGAASGVQRVQLDTGVPIAFGLVTVETRDQALARSDGPGGHNVGESAAAVAVEMARMARRH
ncbi:MAG: 6,7-dimethyl-8-ribityllumazine synthase [Acidimicrobiales bacterium]|nr:6,7-dimethyl-8-ribityllumazine synthase [Acidimicrobiales bacterium]